LVRAAQAGDEQAAAELVRRYRPLVRGKARSFYLLGADREDVVQEGLIGLFKAIRDYDPGRETAFHSFAELCVTRQMISAVKSATRMKHSPLNGYLSLSRPAGADEEGERLLSDILAAKGLCDPCELVIGALDAESIRTGMAGALSPLETDVLRLYVAGHSYDEIASELGRHAKAVDNALQRIKRKIEAQLERCRAH
jgi:RNA polymerase sporulation-specific sigma factor